MRQMKSETGKETDRSLCSPVVVGVLGGSRHTEQPFLSSEYRVSVAGADARPSASSPPAWKTVNTHTHTLCSTNSSWGTNFKKTFAGKEEEEEEKGGVCR